MALVPDQELVDDILRYVEHKLVRHNEMRAERKLEPYVPDKAWLIGETCAGVSWVITGVAQIFDTPGDLEGDVYTELHYPTGDLIPRLDRLVKIREAHSQEFRGASLN